MSTTTPTATAKPKAATAKPKATASSAALALMALAADTDAKAPIFTRVNSSAGGVHTWRVAFSKKALITWRRATTSSCDKKIVSLILDSVASLTAVSPENGGDAVTVVFGKTGKRVALSLSPTLPAWAK